MFKKFFLTYNPKLIQDGYCAQLQRQIGLIAIAKKFGMSFTLTNIESITITPMDGNSDEEEAKNFINSLNSKFFKNYSKNEIEFNKIIDIPTPTLKHFFRILIMNFALHGKVLIQIANPSGVIEKFPNSYIKATRSLITSRKSDSNMIEIVAHIRMPSSLDHIVPGENKSRYLSETYYITIIDEILRSANSNEIYRITVLTDAPEFDTKFNVIDSQKEKYMQYDYLINNNAILVQGHSLIKLKEKFGEKVNIIRGGDLYDALELMGKANYFIMSRSSMSFIGGLINMKGKVFYPPDFWHKPMKKWIKVTSNYSD